MKVNYIYHSCFLVETNESYYLFDYYKGELPKLDKDKPIIVFGSHFHPDHYNSKIFSLLKEIGMNNIFAVLADDIFKNNYPEGIEVLRVAANKSYELARGEKLETLLSTDSGVAFLLTTSEGTIYHAGDLNDWTWEGEGEKDNKEMQANYRQEIDKLKGRNIDIAFIPLDPRQEQHYAAGMTYFLSTVAVKKVYPMHYWKKAKLIDKFLQEYPQYTGIVQYTEE